MACYVFQNWPLAVVIGQNRRTDRQRQTDTQADQTDSHMTRGIHKMDAQKQYDFQVTFQNNQVIKYKNRGPMPNLKKSKKCCHNFLRFFGHIFLICLMFKRLKYMT